MLPTTYLPIPFWSLKPLPWSMQDNHFVRVSPAHRRFLSDGTYITPLDRYTPLAIGLRSYNVYSIRENIIFLITPVRVIPLQQSLHGSRVIDVIFCKDILFVHNIIYYKCVHSSPAVSDPKQISPYQFVVTLFFCP